MPDQNKNISEQLLQLVDPGSEAQLQEYLQVPHPAELAEVLDHMDEELRQHIFQLMDRELAGDVLRELDEDVQAELVESVGEDELSQILEEMHPDDAADVIGDIEEDKAERVLQLMPEEERSEVEELLQYDEESAGGIMTSELLAFGEKLTVGELVSQLREIDEIENFYYVFVIAESGRLLGKVSLQALLLSPTETRLKELYDPEVVVVTPDLDQEEVAGLVSKYDLPAVAVVDDDGRLIGRITVDDVIDVIEDEASEDIFKMAGTSDDELLTKSAWRVAALRMPWLSATLVGGIAIAFLMAAWGALEEIVALAYFIPLVMGMGGNIGIQSSTIIIRGLSTGQIVVEELFSLLLKEIRVGLIMGIGYGFLIGLLALLFDDGHPVLGLVVGLSMWFGITFAALVGTTLPMLFKKLDKDPAIAAGPFVTTIIDVMALCVFFFLSTVLKEHLI